MLLNHTSFSAWSGCGLSSMMCGVRGWMVVKVRLGVANFKNGNVGIVMV